MNPFRASKKKPARKAKKLTPAQQIDRLLSPSPTSVFNPFDEKSPPRRSRSLIVELGLPEVRSGPVTPFASSYANAEARQIVAAGNRRVRRARYIPSLEYATEVFFPPYCLPHAIPAFSYEESEDDDDDGGAHSGDHVPKGRDGQDSKVI